jgi:hypothetical protein
MQSAFTATRPAGLIRPAAASRPAQAQARRGSLQVLAAKGGEEGGKTWDRSVIGRVGASGNFNLLASSVAAVRIGACRTLSFWLCPLPFPDFVVVFVLIDIVCCASVARRSVWSRN